MRTAWKAIVLVCLVTLLSGCAPRVVDHEQVGQDEKIVIKFSHVVAENTPKGQAALYFARLVAKKTEGYVEVQVYPNSTLFMDGEEIEALQENKVQLIAPATAKMTEYFPQLLVFDLPFLFRDYDHVHAFIESKEVKDLLLGLRSHKMRGLAMWDNGFKMMSANQPLVWPRDYQGLNFRIMGNPLLHAQFKSLGARTTTLPFNEVYEALAQNQVDGAENPPSNFYSKKFFEVQSHLTVSNHGYLGYIVLTNHEFWEELPEEVRQILEEALEETSAWEREYAMLMNRVDLDKILDLEGLTVHIPTEDEKKALREALLPIYETFAGIIGRDLVERALSIDRAP